VRVSHLILKQLADDLAQAVYRLTWKFMQSDPALAQRMRNAAITVGVLLATQPPPTASRSSVRRAIFGAIVVLGELAYCMQFARRAGLIGDTDLKRVFTLKEDLIQRLDVYLTEPSPIAPGSASH